MSEPQTRAWLERLNGLPSGQLEDIPHAARLYYFAAIRFNLSTVHALICSIEAIVEHEKRVVLTHELASLINDGLVKNLLNSLATTLTSMSKAESTLVQDDGAECMDIVVDCLIGIFSLFPPTVDEFDIFLQTLRRRIVDFNVLVNQTGCSGLTPSGHVPVHSISRLLQGNVTFKVERHFNVVLKLHVALIFILLPVSISYAMRLRRYRNRS